MWYNIYIRPPLLTKEEMSKEKTGGWSHLRPNPGDVDEKAIKNLPTSVYGIAGLTAIKEWWLWERLEQSGLHWYFIIDEVNYLGSETRAARASQGRESYEYTVYLASARGILKIEDRMFPAIGASDNRALDAAFTGAVTSAFKNACKWAGLSMHLYKAGNLTDSFEEWEREELAREAAKKPATQSRSASASSAATAVGTPAAVTPATGNGEGVVGPATREQKIVALVWYADQIPQTDSDKALWTQPRILMELGLYERNKRDGKLSEREAKFGDGFRSVFAKIRSVHSKASNCGDDCPHALPVITVFKLGGTIQDVQSQPQTTA